MQEPADLTVLIVDDEVDMRVLIRTVLDLADDGLTVVAEAGDGLEALDAWRALDGPPTPDVVILDNRMPNRDGMDVAREILEERPDQTIVLYSAFLDDQLRAEARALGIASCITKAEVHDLPSVIRAVRAT